MNRSTYPGSDAATCVCYVVGKHELRRVAPSYSDLREGKIDHLHTVCKGDEHDHAYAACDREVTSMSPSVETHVDREWQKVTFSVGQLKAEMLLLLQLSKARAASFAVAVFTSAEPFQVCIGKIHPWCYGRATDVPLRLCFRLCNRIVSLHRVSQGDKSKNRWSLFKRSGGISSSRQQRGLKPGR